MSRTKPASPSVPNVVLRPYRFAAVGPRHWWLAIAAALFCTVYGFVFAAFAPSMIGLLVAPVLVVAGLAIWALPDMLAGPVGPIQPLFFAYFAAMALWPNYLAIALPGLPWITLVRLIAFPLTGLILISLSMSRHFRAELSGITNSASIVWKMVALFVVIQILTLPFSKQIGFSLQIIIIEQINCTLIFFVGSYVFARSGRITIWASIIWLAAVGTSIIGVIEQREGHPPWVGHIPSFLKVNDPLIDLILKGGSRAGAHRVQSTFGTSLGFAEYLALATPFVLHFAIGKRPFLVRVAAIATLPLLLYADLITESRLGVIGVFVGALTYLLFWAVLRWRGDRRSVVGPAVALSYPVIFVLAVAATLFVHRLRAALWGNGSQNDSNAGRAGEWAAAIPKILQNPIGHGAGTGGAVLNYLEADGRPTIDSYYLSVALEYGVLGLILFYGVIIYAIYLCMKIALTSAMREFEQSLILPIAASMATFLFTKSVLSESDNNPIVFALMAMVVALIYRSRQSPAPGTAEARTRTDSAPPGERIQGRAHGSAPLAARSATAIGNTSDARFRWRQVAWRRS